jgi:uncharacterized protein (TIGR00255 family)
MTVYSMTGFGRARRRLSDAWSASIVVRSVNHKGLDVQVRHNLREELPELEQDVRTVAAEQVHRGRVVVQLSFEAEAGAPPAVSIDQRLARSLVDQLSGLEAGSDQLAPPTLGDILAAPGVVVSAPVGASLLGEAERVGVRELTAEALAVLRAGRKAEGQQLVAQIQSELEQIEAIIGSLEARQDGIRDRLLARMRERLTAVLGPDLLPDPERLLQEAAVLADRSDVAEELVRLRSHLGQLHSRLEEGGAVGKALDFVSQELTRELNTVASKCREVGLTERIVDAKAAVERIREQVQNLE